MLSDGGVSAIRTTPLSLSGLATEGVPHDIEATELSLQVGTEQHSAGDMLEALALRTQCFTGVRINSDCEEKHTNITEDNGRIETTNDACGTPLLPVETDRRVLQDDGASASVDDNPPSSSLPPSSSPAQVFSSSPFASSQSSFTPSDKVSGVRAFK